MEKEKLGSEPAFPIKVRDSLNGNTVYGGMSKRLYLAGMAMQGQLANPNIKDSSPLGVAKWSLEYSDALLKAEQL